VSLIVYVEDEFFARMLGEDVLNAAGYDVLVAADGEEGCALLRRHGSGVSGLITDINLPGVTEGWAVAELGREIREGLAVVYATGSDRSLFAARGRAAKPMDRKTIRMAARAGGDVCADPRRGPSERTELAALTFVISS
jgi:CheY-like chemotaxis protein